MVGYVIGRITGAVAKLLRETSDEVSYLRYVEDRHRRRLPDEALMTRAEYEGYLAERQGRNPKVPC